MKTTSRGPVTIESIEQGKTEGWARVRFNQKVTTEYNGGDASSPTGLGLQSVAGDPAKFDSTRHCSETVSTDVLEKLGLSEGSEVKGVNIARYAHKIPVWDGQNPAADGKFYTTKVVAEGAQTDYEVEQETSQKMYDAWKAASSATVSITAPAQVLGN